MIKMKRKEFSCSVFLKRKCAATGYSRTFFNRHLKPELSPPSSPDSATNKAKTKKM